MKLVVKWPGCGSPEIQGYFAASWGDARDPPTWHIGHKEKEFIEGWLKGWDLFNGRDNDGRRSKSN